MVRLQEVWPASKGAQTGGFTQTSLLGRKVSSLMTISGRSQKKERPCRWIITLLAIQTEKKLMIKILLMQDISP